MRNPDTDLMFSHAALSLCLYLNHRLHPPEQFHVYRQCSMWPTFQVFCKCMCNNGLLIVPYSVSNSLLSVLLDCFVLEHFPLCPISSNMLSSFVFTVIVYNNMNLAKSPEAVQRCLLMNVHIHSY